ncbi:McrB family protein [Glutamicibacter arilaitensis]|uniref:McrB family protein n=1 Tax=Glutamicibacter arilaitensis TaxID=256701 RepID=UPI003A93075B
MSVNTGIVRLLEEHAEAQVRQIFNQVRIDGTVSAQMRSAVFCVFGYDDELQANTVTSTCQEALGRKFEAYPAPGEPLKQFVVIREDISSFLRLLDPEWPGEGSYSKSPRELVDQWDRALNPVPRLLAAGTMIENLRRKSGPKDDRDPHGYVWIKFPVEALKGTTQDAELCNQGFSRWMQENAKVVAIAPEKSDEELIPAGTDIDQLVSDLDTYKNVILEGVAGSGKTHTLEALKVAYSNRTSVLVFHPSTSYEDFVVGLRPNLDSFEVVPGPFLRMCERATRDPEQNYLLFLDEINRANTARVLGDLLMVIEPSKRSTVQVDTGAGLDEPLEHWLWQTKDFHTVLTDSELHEQSKLNSVELQTSLPGDRRHLVVPPNLHIIGTMNTTDRSVGTIDLALRRRFWWKTQEVLAGKRLEVALGKDRAQELEKVIAWHEHVNQKLNDAVGPDARLGHSYFFTEDATAKDIAEALVQQLAEIAHIFNLNAETVAAFFDDSGTRLPNEMRLYAHGRGLGRRFLTVPSSTTPS